MNIKYKIINEKLPAKFVNVFRIFEKIKVKFTPSVMSLIEIGIELKLLYFISSKIIDKFFWYRSEFCITNAKFDSRRILIK